MPNLEAGVYTLIGTEESQSRLRKITSEMQTRAREEIKQIRKKRIQEELRYTTP